jgi:hypothetical protein
VKYGYAEMLDSGRCIPYKVYGRFSNPTSSGPANETQISTEKQARWTTEILNTMIKRKIILQA